MGGGDRAVLTGDRVLDLLFDVRAESDTVLVVVSLDTAIWGRFDEYREPVDGRLLDD